MNTHICLISGELMPNIIGALYDHADAIIPVITSESEKSIDPLCKSLAATDLKVNVEQPVKIVPYDMKDCIDSFRSLARKYHPVCFNWTGGTKVMSYAARFIAESEKARAIFLKGNTTEILIEDFLQNKQDTHIISSTDLGLNVLSYLLASGHTVSGASTPKEFHKRYRPAEELIVAANAIIDANRSERQDFFALANAENHPVVPRKLNKYFLQIFCKARLIQPSKNAGEYFLNYDSLMPTTFMESPQQSNARFLRGSFLEVFLWHQIVQRSGFDEVGWGVQLNPGQTGKFMEIDLVVAGDTRLIVIEAKLNVDLHNLTDLIEEQHARCNRIAGRLGRWILYVHKFKGEFMNEGDSSRIASAEARARHFGGLLLWHDNLEEMPSKVCSILNENNSAI